MTEGGVVNLLTESGVKNIEYTGVGTPDPLLEAPVMPKKQKTYEELLVENLQLRSENARLHRRLECVANQKLVRSKSHPAHQRVFRRAKGETRRDATIASYEKQGYTLITVYDEETPKTTPIPSYSNTQGADIDDEGETNEGQAVQAVDGLPERLRRTDRAHPGRPATVAQRQVRRL